MFFDRVHPYVLKFFQDQGLTPADRYLFTIASLQLFMLAFADDIALIAAGPAQL